MNEIKYMEMEDLNQKVEKKTKFIKMKWKIKKKVDSYLLLANHVNL